MYRGLLLLAAASGALAFSPSAPGVGMALRRSHAARQQRSARHRVVCQAAGGTAAIDVESTSAEPFLTFSGVSEKVMHAQEPPFQVHTRWHGVCARARVASRRARVSLGMPRESLSAPTPDPVPAVVSQIRPLEEVELEGQLDADKAAAKKKAFPLSEDELINLTKQFLNVQFGGAFKSNPKQLTFFDVSAPDFKFVAPVVGPLSRDAFSEAFGSFKLGEAFPDGEPNYYNFHQDPFEPNRIFFASRFQGTNTGTIAGVLPSTGKRVESPPQYQSCTFNEKGEVTKYTIGYVVDKEVGNTGGLGGAYGIFYAIGYGLPFPEAQPWVPSPPYFLFTRGGAAVAGLIKNLQKLVGQ